LTLPADQQKAFEELDGYPVKGSELANQRYFQSEAGNLELAKSADAELRELTRQFNEKVAGSKWREFIVLIPILNNPTNMV
jgi:hypothetical protein